MIGRLASFHFQFVIQKVRTEDLRKRIQKTFDDEDPAEERVSFKAPDKIETDEVTLKRYSHTPPQSESLNYKFLLFQT